MPRADQPDLDAIGRTDVLTDDQRSRCMSRIRGGDTRPELMIRRGLFARGWRYRLHDARLPGRPDLVFPARRAVIFVHGCFWHMHDWPLFRMPATRRAFWEEKLTGNRARDARDLAALSTLGWRALVIWECTLKGPRRQPVGRVLDLCEGWLRDPRSGHGECAGHAGGDAGPGETGAYPGIA